jgi:ribosomal-protein-alanine N-acetyltransferase
MNATMPKTIRPHVRWMIRRDMEEVLEIERLCFEFPWSEGDFIRCLRQRNCVGMVALIEDRVVGQMIYELHRTRLHLLNFAVLPSMQRRGVGRGLIDKLKRRLSPKRRTRIVTDVRESNLDAQLFFRALGFRAVDVLHDFYDDTTEDAILFQYRLPNAQVKS